MQVGGTAFVQLLLVCHPCLPPPPPHPPLQRQLEPPDAEPWRVQAPQAEARALVALPLLCGGTVGLVLALVLLKAQATAAWPAWQLALVPPAVAAGVGLLVQALLVPRARASLAHPQRPSGELKGAQQAQGEAAGSSVELAAGKGLEAGQLQALEALPALWVLPLGAWAFIRGAGCLSRVQGLCQNLCCLDLVLL